MKVWAALMPMVVNSAVIIHVVLAGASVSVSADDEVELSEVIVKAIDPNESISRDVYPVTVIDAQRFAGRSMDLNEAINRAVGVKVRAEGGDGSSATVNIRGLEGKAVKVYINGSPLNSPDGSFGINDLPLQLIDRIEIYKGAVPARFGGDGLGAAVNVVIKESHRSYTDASYSVKSLGNHSMYLVRSMVFDKPGITLGVGGFGTLADNKYEMKRPDGPPVTRDHDGFNSLTGGFGVKFHKLGVDEVEVEGAVVASSKELQGVPGYNQGGTQRNFQHAVTDNQVKIGALKIQDDGFLIKTLDLQYALVVFTNSQQFTDTSSVVYDFDGNRSPSLGLSGRGELGFGPNQSDDRRLSVRQRITLGHPIGSNWRATLHNNTMHAQDRPHDDVANQAAGGQVAGYPGNLWATTSSLTLERGIAASRFKFTTSVKHHYFRSGGHLSDPWGNFTGTADYVRQDKQALGANVGFRYDLMPELWVKGSIERAHRLPSAEELFGNGLSVLGSADLKPETATNLDLGLIWSSTTSEGLKRKAEWSVYAYRLENLIKLTGTPIPNYSNVAEARILGTDAEVSADVFPWLYMYANGTWLDARDVARYVPGTTQENFTRNLKLPNMPYLFGNMGAEIHGKPVPGGDFSPDMRLFWDVHAVHEFFYEFELSRNQEKRVPGYVFHTAGLQASFARERYSLSAEAENLFGADRRDQFSNPLPGRVFRAKARVTAF